MTTAPAERDTVTRIAVAATAILAAVLSAKLILPSFAPGAYLPDYAVFWTAARMAFDRPDLLYDFDAVTRAQSWLTDPTLGLRPWAYPPSALLLFGPFGRLPIWWSLLAWNLVSLAAFVMVARRFVAGWGLALALISPPVIWCLLSGQTALLAGAAILLALVELRDRPIAAGILLGIVAAVKPQAVLLAPLALARGGHWTALAAAAASGLAMIAGATLMFGTDAWFEWFGALGEFGAIVDRGRLHWLGLSPLSLAHVIGAPAPVRVAFQLAGVALGVAVAWHAFARHDLRLRAAALVGGSLLCSPYAMPYELAMLAPIAAALLLSGRRAGLSGALLLGGGIGLLPILALLAGAAIDARRPNMVNKPLPAD